jgi:hypothetical protein
MRVFGFRAILTIPVKRQQGSRFIVLPMGGNVGKGSVDLNVAGGSPAASHFSCFAKEK